MTTYNHTLIAATAAFVSAEFPWWAKILIFLGLAVAHLPEDLLPHLHWYDLRKVFAEKSLRQTIGLLIELVGGGLVLPIILSKITGIDFWWLMICVIASSLFDGLVAGHIFVKKPVLAVKIFGFINFLNERAHFWKKWVDDRKISPLTIAIEATQTLVLVSLLFIVIKH